MFRFCFRWMLTLGVFVVPWVWTNPLLAQEPAKVLPPAVPADPLFGWTIENGCVVDTVDGALRLKEGNGWLRSHHQYRDFTLSCEWKALQAQKYDAGIYVRAGREGTPFPKIAYQINFLEGQEGNIGPLAGARSTGLIKPGEWNLFEIDVTGDQVSLKINGQPAYTASGLKQLEGYVGFQVEVPKGGQFLIRNLQLKEKDYVSLFNGRDLTGWEPAEADPNTIWGVTEGLLTCTGQKGPWLRSVAQFGDFNFRLDYQVSPAGNSGVFVRVPKDGHHHRADETKPVAGVEVQILDDADPKYAMLKDYQFGASVYDICGAQPRVSRPAGEWNTLEINCKGPRIVTIHNGHKVTDVRPETHPLIHLRSLSGYLGLQNHSSDVKFRNLRVGPAMDFQD